jgi:hypothetical protein
MKKLLQTIILTSISFSFVGCAYHTTRSYTYGSPERVVVEKQPIIINQAPRYQPVRRAAPVYAPVPEFQTVSFVCY